MSLEGMDVDQARSLAGQLSGYAQALAHITAALTALAAELSHSWTGPASHTFQQHWTAQYRPALDQAAQALASMNTHLVANIEQQVQTSDTNPGGGLLDGLLGGVTLAGLLGGISRDWNDLQDGVGWEGLAQTPLDKVKDLAGTEYVLGPHGEEDYGKTWTQLIDLDHNGPLLKYRESPIFNSLHDNAQVQSAGKLLGDTHGAQVLGTLDKAGKGLGYVATGVDGTEAVYDLHQHEYAAAVGHAVDATSSALMNTDNPATFLAGFDIALLKKDYQLGSQINWSQGIPNPLNVTNLQTDYLPTFKALPGQLVSTLAGVI